jgi:hypothetical protein
MKRILQALICLCLAVLPGLAAAETPHDAEAEIWGYGAICSATTTDGVWGTSYGPQNASYHCNRVEYALRGATYAPIAQWRSTLYRLDGWNVVGLRCDFYSRTFTGYGQLPVDQAFYAAQASGASYCLIVAN